MSGALAGAERAACVFYRRKIQPASFARDLRQPAMRRPALTDVSPVPSRSLMNDAVQPERPESCRIYEGSAPWLPF